MRLSGSAAREVLAAAPLVSIDLVIEKATGDIVRGLGRKVRIKASRGLHSVVRTLKTSA